MTLQIAALASGTGSNVASILGSIAEGSLDARVCLVLSNNPAAPALKKAGAAGIPVWARSHAEFPDREAFDRELVAAVRASGADTVVLAGYMRILSPLFVRAFPGRILNIHPAVLPSFPGAHGGADALAHGVRFTGATVHFVDEETDHGPIIIQAVVPVCCGDTIETLMPRIHAMEHRIYPQALQWLAEGRLRIEGRRVALLPGPGNDPRTLMAPLSADADEAWMVSPALEGF